MTCNWRHVECPEGCGAHVWQFTSKNSGKQYYCDENTFNANYHECKGPTPRPLKTTGEHPTEEKEIDLDVKFAGEPPGLIQTTDEKEPEPKKVMKEVLDKMEPYKDPLELAEEFKTGEQELKFQQGFRLLEIRISKGRRVGNETIPELPEYRHFDYFQSRNIAVDNRDMDIKELISRQYLEIDTTITEQIARDRAKVIQALDAQRRK